MYSHTAQGRHQRRIPPPAPAPLEDRFFTYWSIEGSGSPHEEPPAQNVPIAETLLAHGTGDAYEVEQGQITLQSPQLTAIPTITQGSNLNATGQATLIEPPLSQDTSRLPTERSNMPEEEIVSVIGPNTPAVVMDSVIGILRLQQVGATTQTSAPPSKAIIPPRILDNIAIPHVNLLTSGY